MCLHPEALSTKNSRYHDSGSYLRTVHEEPHNLPSQAQWMIRQTNHPRNHEEKFQLRAETEELRR